MYNKIYETYQFYGSIYIFKLLEDIKIMINQHKYEIKYLCAKKKGKKRTKISKKET